LDRGSYSPQALEGLQELCFERVTSSRRVHGSVSDEALLQITHQVDTGVVSHSDSKRIDCWSTLRDWHIPIEGATGEAYTQFSLQRCL